MTTDVDPVFEVIEPGRYRLRTVDGYHVEVLQMISNCRIVETPEDCTISYDRYWCYPNFFAAMAAAYAWDGKADTEPVGYKKRGGIRLRR